MDSTAQAWGQTNEGSSVNVSTSDQIKPGNHYAILKFSSDTAYTQQYQIFSDKITWETEIIRLKSLALAASASPGFDFIPLIATVPTITAKVVVEIVADESEPKTLKFDPRRLHPSTLELKRKTIMIKNSGAIPPPGVNIGDRADQTALNAAQDAAMWTPYGKIPMDEVKIIVDEYIAQLKQISIFAHKKLIDL